MSEIVVILIVSMVVTLFVKPSWLNWAVSLAGMIIIFGAALSRNAGSSERSLTELYLWVGAWLWGSALATVASLILRGATQVTVKSITQSPWLNGLMSVWWLIFSTGAIGYAFASNIAVIYAKNNEAAWILYNRSMAGAAGGFFFMGLAANSILTALIKPGFTLTGLRISGIAFLAWQDVESYEWQKNKLTFHKKTKFSQRWLRDTSVVVNSAEQATVNQFLQQYLPNRQVQFPSNTQAVG